MIYNGHCHSRPQPHQSTINATPPNSAAAPTAAVFKGAAAAFELVVPAPAVELAPPPTAIEVVPAAAILDDGVAIPDVKGTMVAELAPENATLSVEAVASGMAAVLFGFKTLATIIISTSYYDFKTRDRQGLTHR